MEMRVRAVGKLGLLEPNITKLPRHTLPRQAEGSSQTRFRTEDSPDSSREDMIRPKATHNATRRRVMSGTTDHSAIRQLYDNPVQPRINGQFSHFLHILSSSSISIHPYIPSNALAIAYGHHKRDLMHRRAIAAIIPRLFRLRNVSRDSRHFPNTSDQRIGVRGFRRILVVWSKLSPLQRTHTRSWTLNPDHLMTGFQQ
jgi:hypothetical protein